MACRQRCRPLGSAAMIPRSLTEQVEAASCISLIRGHLSHCCHCCHFWKE
jgi:hypothetical protein